MKNIIKIVALLLTAAIVSGCRSTKNVAYLQGVENLTDAQLQRSAQPYSAKIKPNDMLRIIVSGAEDPDTYMPFNLLTSVPYNENATQANVSLQSYLVDTRGTIDFPVMGKLYVVNSTTDQVKQMITEKLKDYLKADLVVTVRFVNYKISVLGEVNQPGVYTVPDEKISILQALSLAGDLTLYGRRDVVKILREESDGHKTITTLNLNDRNLIFSPFYYLRQGDVVYVEPNKTKAKGAGVGAATNIVFSVVSVVIGVASLIVTVAK
ncbi:polysaccharide export outer membrane protein [Bacteroides luti]|uniref:Polysaccharide export outer membrane protein n=1 Tax=Bacteroides luti TaxID=1297750 RepID=A0A1M4WJM0_9BACE|nr:polysaccharide biosynthesis/export family protein [Bacteroides luti]SHE81350.1 polysaccharide export outer membrane protein [Bacteroides luti]